MYQIPWPIKACLIITGDRAKDCRTQFMYAKYFITLFYDNKNTLKLLKWEDSFQITKINLFFFNLVIWKGIRKTRYIGTIARKNPQWKGIWRIGRSEELVQEIRQSCLFRKYEGVKVSVQYVENSNRKIRFSEKSEGQGDL